MPVLNYHDFEWVSDHQQPVAAYPGLAIFRIRLHIQEIPRFTSRSTVSNSYVPRDFLGINTILLFIPVSL